MINYSKKKVKGVGTKCTLGAWMWDWTLELEDIFKSWMWNMNPSKPKHPTMDSMCCYNLSFRMFIRYRGIIRYQLEINWRALRRRRIRKRIVWYVEKIQWHSFFMFTPNLQCYGRCIDKGGHICFTTSRGVSLTLTILIFLQFLSYITHQYQIALFVCDQSIHNNTYSFKSRVHELLFLA